MSKTLGIILIVGGLIFAVWGAFGFQTKEKVVDIGPLEATRTKSHNVPYAPIIGGLIVIGGVVLVASGKR